LKHKRKVALKVLKPDLAAVLGAERFVQEITTTANLQHPHILPLFDSGTAGETDGGTPFLYYVMPYVEGETLRDKLDRETQLPIDEAVKITAEVADALHHAHKQGVIHRDIKPENILLQNGRPMVADFGIALAVSAAAGGRMTETGLSLGTPHYMSPEQATAEKDLSARSDIYSLGSVLYEMLTGNPPHVGASAQQIIMKIVTEEAAPVSNFRKSVPPNVAAAVAKSLEKLPADRFASASAFATALTDTTFAFSAGTASSTAPLGSASPAGSRFIMLAVVATLATIVAVWGWVRPLPRDVLRVGVVFGEGEGVFSPQNRQFALSPDGMSVVYPGRGLSEGVSQQLWIRDLDSPTSRPLPGTEGGVAPFFSPDGEHVAFVAARQLRVVSATGGAVQTLITDSVMVWGGDWSADNWLYVTMNGRLARVPAGGGAVEVVSIPDTSRSESFHEYPDAHPNGVHVLIQLWIRSVTETEIGVLSLETGQVRSLVQAVNGRFLPNGDVAYVTSNGDLLVAPFDEKAMTFTAPGTVVERGVRIDNWAGAAMFGVSRTGHLMYAPSGEQETDRVVWVDRDGKIELVDPEWGGPFQTPTLSPDGKKLAIVVVTAGGSALWTKDLSGGLPSQLTIGRGPFASPAWSPDSRKVAFVSFASYPAMISARNVDGSGQAEQLSLPLDGISSMTWAPDGRLVYSREQPGGEVDIVAWHPDRDSTERVVVDVDGRASTPTVSPDGRWIAYALSNQTETRNVWVTRFPDGGDDVWRVTVDGGSEPAWAHSGRELFYRTPGGDLMSRRVDVIGDVIRLGEVVSLFDASSFQSNPGEREYDVALDDQRFMMIQTRESTSTLTMVYHWLDVLEAMLGR